MSYSPDIKCGLCGYGFKTYKTTEKTYRDYEEYEEEVYYPCPDDPNHAHLVGNYVCNTCYTNIGKVVLDKLIVNGEADINSFESRKDRLYQNYLKEVEKIKEKNVITEEILVYLRKLNTLADISDEYLEKVTKLNNSVFHSYFLLDSYKIDLKRTSGKDTIYAFERQYGLTIKKYPKDIEGGSKLVTLSEFLHIIEHSELEGITFSELQKKIENIRKNIKDNM